MPPIHVYKFQGMLHEAGEQLMNSIQLLHNTNHQEVG